MKLSALALDYDRTTVRDAAPGKWSIVQPHALSGEQCLERLASDRDGLTDAEASRRLVQIGPNRFEVRKPRSALDILIDQLRSVVVALLVAAAAISFALGQRIETAAILAVLAINTGIGFVTEWRARRALAALADLDVPQAIVVRQGERRAIDAHHLVPGDVIELNAGQHVPADGRAVELAELRVDEAALTGESMPVSKRIATLDAAMPLADRTNMVHKGTIVLAGTARAVITATGARTELGRIGVLVEGIDADRTPLEKRLDTLAHRLVWLTLAVAAIVGGLGIYQGHPLALVLETAIALAVAAVPEALPAVATIALAVGVHRMARRRALVRRLPVAESLGSTTVVCTDKTRTLTSGDMSVVRLWAAGEDVSFMADDATPHGPAVVRALEIASLASRPQVGLLQAVDPVDHAIVMRARDAGIDWDALDRSHPLVALVPFSTERKLMAAFRQSESGPEVFVKGAPRRVIALCDYGAAGEALDDAARSELMAVNNRFAAAGLRVLGVAFGPAGAIDAEAIGGLTFVGFAGFMDPPAPGVKETIARLRGAGLRTVMLTGDQRLTAEAIGRQLGVLTADAQVIDGRELESLSPHQLAARVGTVGAYCRISPEHKLAVVSALQARGDVVAMLGDGVNDAAALKRADVGVCMGERGTDVAKEAASIILQDDRFETIAAAVEEGRVIFDNIRKFVFYLFSCNVAEVFVLLVAGLAAWPMPLLPLQLLWLNMLTDTFPALALAMEPGDANVMTRPPRDPKEGILSRAFLASILGYATLITLSTIGAFLWVLVRNPDHAQTAAFMTLAIAQTLHLGNARRVDHVLEPRHAISNPYALGAVALSLVLQLAAMYVPVLAAILHVATLTRDEWIVVLVVSAVPALAGQTIKMARARRRRYEEGV